MDTTTFLYIPISLLSVANAEAAVSYTKRDSDKGSRSAPCPEPLLPVISPVLLLAAFLFFLYLLCLCGISHTLTHRCSSLIPLPLGPVFMIQASKAISLACPELQRAAEGCQCGCIA